MGFQMNPNTVTNPGRVQSIKDGSLWLGHAWIDQNDILTIDQAVEFYGAEIKKNPSISYFWMMRGLAWLGKGEADKALGDFDEAQRLDPASSQVHLSRARALKEKEELGLALVAAEEALGLAPTDPRAYFLIGAIQVAGGNNEEGVKAFSKAIEADTAEPLYYCGRADTFAVLGRNVQAIQDFSQAIQLNPLDASQYCFRGELWRKLGKSVNALDDFTTAIRVSPRCVDGYACRAMLLAAWPDLHVRDGEKAVIDATQACELCHWRNPFAVDALATAYAECGDYDRAIELEGLAIEVASNENEAKKYRRKQDLFKGKMPYRFSPILDLRASQESDGK